MTARRSAHWRIALMCVDLAIECAIFLWQFPHHDGVPHAGLRLSFSSGSAKREALFVRKTLRTRLGRTQVPGAVLLSDGYAAYERYAEKTGMTHAQCRGHTRRGFFEAQAIEAQAAA